MSNGSNGTPTGPPYPLDVATFRLLFSAFADDTVYPDTVVQMWLDLAANFVNCIWGPTQGFGQGLWAAHEMAKMAMAGQPGQSLNGISGIVSNKSVDSVSVAYDTQTGTIEGAGSYNLTVYGRQYYQLMRVFGLGPFQFGPPEPPPIGSGYPWLGPVPYLGYDF
jgi:hypothetical protein